MAAWLRNYNPDEDYVVIPVIESTGTHTPEHPMCPDPTCPCHEDQDAINDLNKQVQNGLLTRNEATNIVKARNI